MGFSSSLGLYTYVKSRHVSFHHKKFMFKKIFILLLRVVTKSGKKKVFTIKCSSASVLASSLINFSDQQAYYYYCYLPLLVQKGFCL